MYPSKPTGDNVISESFIFAANQTNKSAMTPSELLSGYNNKGEAETDLTSRPDANKLNGFLYQVHNTFVWAISYLDALTSQKVEKTGDSMSGILSMGSNKITNLATPTTNSDATTKQYVDNAVNGAMWLGEVKNLSYPTIPALPSGYEVVNADGRALSRTTYASLFALIGTTFGAGNGSTTFNIPSILGKEVVGWDSTGALDAGRVFGSDQKREASKFITKYNMGAGVGAGSGTATQNGLIISYSNTYQYPCYITIDGVTVEGVWGANDGVPVAQVSAEVRKGQSYSAVGQSTAFYPEVESNQNSNFTQTNIALYPVIRIR